MSISEYSHPSVYQTSGKPLSREALYKAKLRYGIFESPSKVNSGFTNSADASDTAALLAASSDLSIEPYKRNVAIDAQTAALLAKDDAPSAWKRDKIDLDAQYAAQNAKISQVIKEQRSSKSQGSAASAALHSSAKSIASSSLSSKNLDSLYQFDEIRNGSKRPTNAFDLSKIALVSQKNANTSLSQRIDPEKNVSRSGLRSNSIASKNFATVGALASQKPEDLSDKEFELANFAAAGALASQGYKVPEDPNLEAKAVYRNQMVDPKVLSTATLNASKTLKGIDKYVANQNTTSNMEFNKIALEIAQRHSQKRQAGEIKVNLGGGLYMTQAELDAIASKFVNPVLETIDKQATAQRERDFEEARKAAEIKKQYEEVKLQEKAAKVEAKRLKEEAKIQRRKEIEDEKQKQIDAKKELEQLKLEELSKTEEILKTKQLEESKRKAELIEQKETETSKLSKEAQEAQEARDLELKELEDAKAEKLSPILKDLAVETDKLNLLKKEKESLEEITKSQVLKIENSKKLIETSHLELTNLGTELETLKSDIAKATSEEDKLRVEKELNDKETEILLQKHKDEELTNNLKKLELESSKNAVEEEKLKLLLDLENEKIDALNDEKKILETLPPKLEKTFSGFTQGSEDEKDINDGKRKSFFKEIF